MRSRERAVAFASFVVSAAVAKHTGEDKWDEKVNKDKQNKCRRSTSAPPEPQRPYFYDDAAADSTATANIGEQELEVQQQQQQQLQRRRGM